MAKKAAAKPSASALFTAVMTRSKEATNSFGFTMTSSSMGEGARLFPRGNQMYVMKDVIGGAKKIRVTVEVIE